MSFQRAHPGARARTPVTCHDRLIVAAPLDHPILAASRLRWRDLGEHSLILVGGGATEQQVRAALPGASYPIEVTHLATAVAMVRRGLGVAVTPTSAIEGLDVTGLGLAPLSDASARRELGYMHRANREVSPAARQFLSLVSEHAPRVMADWDQQLRARPSPGRA